MPASSDTPGLKRGRVLQDGTPLWYWMARQVVRDIRGYPDKCVALPRGASHEQLGELCRAHTASLQAWLAQLDADPDSASDAQLVANYNGTMESAIAVYRGHTMSPFNEVKASTRKTYNDSLKVIEGTVAKRAIGRLNLIDAKRWYKEWRKPAATKPDPATGVQPPPGPERIDRAHDAISMVRQLVGFCTALGFKDCTQFGKRLAKGEFAKGVGRDQAMTYPQAFAFVRTVLDLGNRDVIPAWRALSMAIGVAAQFELGVRQMDVIGEWRQAVLETEHAIYDNDGKMWIGSFRWDTVPGWKWRLKTSKNKSPTIFTLSDYPLLFPLLERVPHDERVGSIVKGEHGLPVRAVMYRRWFRKYARLAGIPDQVWNMDSRAGAATEAEEAGVDTTLIQGLLTHTDARMTEHYIRRRERGNKVIAKARVEHRAKQEGGDA